VGDAKVFMFMCKCLSVISSSSRYRRGTVPTRDSRHVSTRFSVSTSNIHPSSSPSTLRGDRHAHRVPDLPREDKKSTCTLRLSQHSSSPCSPRTKQAFVSARFSLHPRASHMKMHIANTSSEYPTRPTSLLLRSSLSLPARDFSPLRSAISSSSRPRAPR